jgi:polynucleotide 5'-kinase involved in rRNA processing
VERYGTVVQRIVAGGGVVMLVGGLDSGKSTLAKTVAGAGLLEGRTVGYVDSDLGQKTVGPPAAVTLRMMRSGLDLEPPGLAKPDALSFVGSTSPQGQLLPLVVGTARMMTRAIDEGADLIVVDTSGLVSGVYGQILKYHKVEMLQPDVVIGLQRGEELEPILGIIQRFFSCDVITLPVHQDIQPTSVDERAERREAAFRGYFEGTLQRWRIKPTVFMPALPALFEQSQLDRLLVGLSDGKGEYIGIGYLEYSSGEDVLRLLSPVAEAPKALKLGSVRVEEDYRTRRVDLRNLFGTD